MTIDTLLTEYDELAKNTSEKGFLFENLIKIILEKDRVYRNEYEKVWLWKDFPYNGNTHDTGIDIVAKKRNINEYTAIQCKFFSKGRKVYKKDIDSFLSDSGKSFKVDGKSFFYSDRLIISAFDRWSDNVKEAVEGQSINVTTQDLKEFIENSDLDLAHFSFKKHMDAVKFNYTQKVLRKDQKDAITAVIEGFETADRGKLIMACGTGKTFTSLKLAEKYAGKGKTILFLAPSISLVSQTIREWIKESSLQIGCIPVCSDSHVGRRDADKDVMGNQLEELIFPASTNADKFEDRFNQMPSNVMRTVFSTYQSIDVVKQGQDKCGFEFDLIICDEAHRTTGITLSNGDESHFVKIHDNNFIKGKKRLYMTATPRVYGDNVKTKAQDTDAVLCSMDDERIFGKNLYVLSFGQAVNMDLLSDYKVLVLSISEGFVHKNFQEYIADARIDDIGKMVGCWRALSKLGILDDTNFMKTIDPEPMRRAVGFAGNIDYSKMIAEKLRQLSEDEKYNVNSLIRLHTDHVDGSMDSSTRNEKLQDLRKEKVGTCNILMNARCLSEGIDVPDLDAVIFFSPRNSMVDIVQSVGRVMRKSNSKKYGYIILPVVVPANVTPEEALNDNKNYKVVWDVLQALRSHDDTFSSMINSVEFDKTACSKVMSSHIGEQERVDAQVRSYNLELDIAFYDWNKAILSRMVKKCGDKLYWENWAGDVAEIAKKQIEIIKNILNDKKSEASKAFKGFVENLRQNINEEITEDDAIEMISQHIITKPVFDALFQNYSFVKNNPVSIAMQEIIGKLDNGKLTQGLKKLDRFYISVKNKTQGVKTAEGKQQVIIKLYDSFFRLAFKNSADKLGIVYTPVEPVDFIIRSVNTVLKEKFGKSLNDKDVHIIDPFTGTGTFIVRLLQSGFISKENLKYKYKNEIHANEIVLLAYYIAAINIEETYHKLHGETDYQPFDGIVLTDTFAMEETKNTVGELAGQYFEGNTSRLSKQKACKIRVILGNPPYSKGQRSANDNNKNTNYPFLEKSITDTYAKFSHSNNKNSLYDSYIKAFRWAANRIEKDEGVIAFITNGGYIDSKAMDGFRKCISEEFSDIYCFNLRGDQRTQGELSRKEGGKIFGSGSRAAIAISILVKDKNHKGPVNTNYYDIGDYLTRNQKLEIIAKSNLETMNWREIALDKHYDWVNQRSSIFNYFPPIGDKKDKNAKPVFLNYTRGISSARDAWAYNYDGKLLKTNMINMIRVYNTELEKVQSDKIKPDEVTNDPKLISWADKLKQIFNKKTQLMFKPDNVRISMYRLFSKKYQYYDKDLLERTYQMSKIFPTAYHENILICVNGTGGKNEFMPFIVNCIPDVGLLNGGAQCFPLYEYTHHSTGGNIENFLLEADRYGYTREYAVTDDALREYQSRYGGKVTKEDIFYYIYGLFHSEDYASQFSNDLKKALPRIPYVKKSEDFVVFKTFGKHLADLHLYYEKLPPYPVDEIFVDERTSYKVNKMKFKKEIKSDKNNAKKEKKDDKTTIIFNSQITIEQIPLEAYDYVVNGRSPIEWIMECYQIKTDKDSGIKNDPNEYSTDPKYIYNLLKSVITLSVETIKIIKLLPKLDI